MWFFVKGDAHSRNRQRFENSFNTFHLWQRDLQIFRDFDIWIDLTYRTRGGADRIQRIRNWQPGLGSDQEDPGRQNRDEQVQRRAGSTITRRLVPLYDTPFRVVWISIRVVWIVLVIFPLKTPWKLHFLFRQRTSRFRQCCRYPLFVDFFMRLILLIEHYIYDPNIKRC